MNVIDLSPFMEGAVTEVLEAMCFTSAEGLATAEEAQLETELIWGELDFMGDVSGTFGIGVTLATAATIAANFLGEEEAGLTQRETSEVICELTNMVCGTLLAQVNSKNIFTLSSPRPGSSGVPAAHHERIHRTYSIDNGYIHAWLEMRAFA